MKANARQDDPCNAEPLVLVCEHANGTVIDAVNAKARQAGAKVGQRLTDARAICPVLLAEPSDTAGDAVWLEKFAQWAHRWCPWTAVDGDAGVLLDTTGASHCFGGEDAMLADIRASCSSLGFTGRGAMAPTIGAAWALARFGTDGANINMPKMRSALDSLPVEALRIDPETALLLRRVGLKTIGALADLPTLALARRFRSLGLAKRFAYRTVGASDNPLHRLQQALGQIAEVVEPLSARTVYRAHSRVLEPIRHVALLEPVLSDLAHDLCEQLAADHQGLRRVRFQAFRVDGDVPALYAETAAPVRAPAHIVRLFTEKLEALDAGFGFDAFALTALRHEGMAAHQLGLDEEKVEGISLADLIDRLSSRIGSGNVQQPVPFASHLPERSVSWRPALEMGLTSIKESTLAIRSPERPIRLFDHAEPITVIYATPEGPPRRFRWRSQLHDIVKVEGPERIAPEWWRERSNTRLRDYYKVEDETGRRFWIYRGGVVGDGRGSAPAWFMHGLFV